MIPIGSKLVKDIERTVKAEIALYVRYIEALRVEREAFKKFDPEAVSELTKKRAVLVSKLGEANQKRLDLMQKFPESNHSRLSERIRKFCHPQDQKVLLPLLEELRARVKESRKEGLEMSSLSAFAQKVVNGTLSIIWSATQNVVASYTKKGRKDVKYNPTKDRRQSVLKQA